MPVLSRPIYRMRVEWRRHSRSKASRRVPCSTTFDLQVEILARTPIFVSAWYPWIDSRSGHGCIVLLCLPFYVRCTFYGLRRGWAILALFLGKIHFFVTTGHAMLPLVNKHALYTMCNLLIFTFLPSFRYFCLDGVTFLPVVSVLRVQCNTQVPPSQSTPLSCISFGSGKRAIYKLACQLQDLVSLRVHLPAFLCFHWWWLFVLDDHSFIVKRRNL